MLTLEDWTLVDPFELATPEEMFSLATLSSLSSESGAPPLDSVSPKSDYTFCQHLTSTY